MAQEELVNHVPIFARNLPILLVDNDEASLASLASTLEKFSYKVTTTTSRSLALSIIRQQNGGFKLVMTNVNIFDSESLRFVHQVVKEQIPIVVIMSNDNMEFATKALAEGASFCLERPLSLTDVKNIWQHACRRRCRNIDMSPETNNHNIDQQHHTIIVDKQVVVGIGNNDCQTQFGSIKRKSIHQNDDGEAAAAAAAKKHKADQVDFNNVESNNNLPQGLIVPTSWTENNQHYCISSNSTSKRRPRVVWTAELHLKFTAALTALGDTRARPKSILQKMNVPYLTQRQVASHLQKYKAQVQRISEIAEADTSSFTIRGYGSDTTTDNAYHSVETLKDPWSEKCETNLTNIIGAGINNFVYDSNFSHIPVMSLHDPSNIEFGDQSYDHVAGLDSFNEDFALPEAISVAALESNGEVLTASTGATSTNLSIFDIPTSDSIMEMEHPTYLVNHSLTDKTDLCKMSDEGIYGEPNIDHDSNQYMEWLVDVLPENN